MIEYAFFVIKLSWNCQKCNFISLYSNIIIKILLHDEMNLQKISLIKAFLLKLHVDINDIKDVSGIIYKR